MTDVYLQLDYRAYKHLEQQLRDWESIETVHLSMDQRYYHKALRLEIGDITLEIQGPAVREAIQEAKIPEEREQGGCTCVDETQHPQCANCQTVSMYMVGKNIRMSHIRDAEAVQEKKDPLPEYVQAVLRSLADKRVTADEPTCACIGTCTDCPAA